MVIVGDNLLDLIKDSKICPEKLYDEFSVSITLDAKILRPNPVEQPISYITPKKPMEECYSAYDVSKDGILLLKKGEMVLACSEATYKMPPGYFGLVQTKGTLGRLFVSAHCSDGQIEPGFTGKITLELINHGAFDIEIVTGSPVAQLFIFRCSLLNTPLYHGNYANAVGPTIPILGNGPMRNIAPVTRGPAWEEDFDTPEGDMFTPS